MSLIAKYLFPIISPMLLAFSCALFSYSKIEKIEDEKKLKQKGKKYDDADRRLYPKSIWQWGDLYVNLAFGFISYDLAVLALAKNLGQVISLWAILLLGHIVYLGYVMSSFSRAGQTRGKVLAILSFGAIIVLHHFLIS